MNNNNQHRYNDLSDYLKNKYHKKVFKVSLNGNFSCPNRDGLISTKGCIFCSEKGSGDFAGERTDSLREQFKKVKEVLHHKWPDAYYIAYFQANTNTYGPISKLKKLYYEAINLDPDIVILSIATRPDCLNEEVLCLLQELKKEKEVWVELGLQTIHEQTATLINRGYTLEVFEEAVKKLRAINIEVIVHIINGLPFETPEMMLDTVKYLNTLDIQGIKIHSLFVLKGTELANMYNSHQFELMELDQYVPLVASQLSLLNPKTVIHRISGDAPNDLLIAPKWSQKKLVVMNEIDKYMKQNGLFQGITYNK